MNHVVIIISNPAYPLPAYLDLQWFPHQARHSFAQLLNFRIDVQRVWGILEQDLAPLKRAVAADRTQELMRRNK